MNSSIIWYPLLYRTTHIFSKNGDWKLGHMSYIPMVAPLYLNLENRFGDKWVLRSFPIGPYISEKDSFQSRYEAILAIY